MFKTLFRQIDKHDIISFDIFDTLLKRDVFSPKDAFSIVERQYSHQIGENVKYKNARIEAEKKAREASQYPEITFDEIYEKLELLNKKALKKIELDVESMLLHVNPTIKHVYDYCIDHGKTIYIISDMYLPSSFLEMVLKREGINNFKKIFVSCEYRKTKRSGELFRSFCEKENINPKNVLHIGDSRYADYIGPRKVGIKGYHIDRLDKQTLYLDVPKNDANLSERTVFAFVNSRLGKLQTRAEQLGFEILGPILFAFSKWIHEKFIEKKGDNGILWFAARDMFLFKQAYQLIYGDESEANYVYISRKSLRPVLGYTTGDITESGEAFARGQYTLQSIVEKMGYNVDDLMEGTVVDDKRYDIRSLSEYPEVRKALSSPAILESEKKLAEIGVEYLRDNGLFDSDVVLADVGWHGTTQYLLKRIQESISKNGSIYGLYLGCLDSTNERIGKGNYSSFAFNEDKNSDFSKGILLFEALILAPHGSTVKYKKKNGHVVPELGEPDNMTSFLADIQKGALDFVKSFSNSPICNSIELTADIATKAFCSLAISPRKEELDTIGELDYDDFGIGKMAAPKPMIKYIAHPRLLYYDFKHSPWRVGFLYKLFKVRLPYAKIYSVARKKQGKMT